MELGVLPPAAVASELATRHAETLEKRSASKFWSAFSAIGRNGPRLSKDGLAVCKTSSESTFGQHWTGIC